MRPAKRVPGAQVSLTFGEIEIIRLALINWTPKPNDFAEFEVMQSAIEKIRRAYDRGMAWSAMSKDD